MKKLPIFVILWVCWFSSHSKGNVIKALTTNLNNVHSKTSAEYGDFIQTTECSGAIEAANGQVLYKVGEGLASYETCIWVLRTHNTTDYSVGIFSMGFSNPSEESRLTLSCVAFGSPLTHLVPYNVGLHFMTNCTYIIVTFTTGNIMSPDLTGFSLQFAGYHNGVIRTPSLSSRDFVVDSNVGYLRYPSVGYIGPWELSTFVFLPSQPEDGVNIIYVRNELEAHRDNFLTVYALNKSSSEPWIPEDKIYYDTETAVISSQEAVLIIFENAYEDYYNRGFHFITKCPKDVEIPTSIGTNYPTLETRATTDPPTTTDSSTTWWMNANLW